MSDRPTIRLSDQFVGNWNHHGLDLGVGLDRLDPAFATKAGLLVTAEWRMRLDVVAVDAERAGTHGLRHPECSAYIDGVDGRAQAVVGLVGEPDRFFLFSYRDHRE